MKGIFLSLALATLTIFEVAPRAVAEYSPRAFFKAAPPSTFYTEDEMSEADRAGIVRSGFKPQVKFTCEKWGVADETPSSLLLKNCADSSVRIQVYPSTSGDSVVAVESNRSSGRAVNIAFFKVAAGSNSIKPIPSSELTSIGIDPLTENDFLQAKDHFKASENEVVSLYIENDGSLAGGLSTWMNPRWEKRQQAYSVSFTWTGQRFELSKKPLER